MKCADKLCFFYKQIKHKTKRRPYIKSDYFDKQKVCCANKKGQERVALYVNVPLEVNLP